ncbi:hypothetical protein [Bacillus sp. P14.5]|uniref:hypothetical protein n=1 Tax=Bacillus sp. P14.5 TaxID=1983400 RepID=UPI0013B04E1C|nr:hypothetical protein [Bacillus sp. P14.5]
MDFIFIIVMIVPSTEKKVKEMTNILQKPFDEDRSFEEVIQDKKSLVVFVRHPG